MRKIAIYAVLWTFIFLAAGYAAKQTIDIGTSPTSNVGAFIRDAADITNDNFDELYADAKGDVIVGTAADTVQQQTVGSDNEVWIADSTQTTGVKYNKVEPINMGSITPGAGVDEYSLTYEHDTQSWELQSTAGAQNLYDEIHGDSGTAVVGSPSDILSIQGAASGHITTLAADSSPDYLTIAVDDDFLLNTGDVGTGEYDFGGATSVELPNGTAPSLDALGELAFDSNQFTGQSSINWYDTTGTAGLRYVVSTTNTPSDDYIPKYDSGTGTITWEADLTGGTILSYDEWTGDTGSATAGSSSDIMNITGDTYIATTIADSSPDYMQIDYTGLQFKTVDVPAGTDPVATDHQDTLTFTNGANVSITGTGSNTISIAATDTDDQWLYDEIHGDSGTAVVGSDSDILSIQGAASGHITTLAADSSPDYLTIAVDDDFLLNTGDVGTGEYDFGGATSLELPNGTAPSLDALGELAFDSDQFTGQSSINWYDTTGTPGLRYVVSTTNTPSDDYIPKYDSGTGTITWEADLTGGTILSYDEWTGDTGSATAGSSSDIMNITGDTYIATTIADGSPDYMQIDYTGLQFKTVDVPAGTDPVATDHQDTLTLTNGANVSITGTGSNTISIAATDTDDQWLYDEVQTDSGTVTAGQASDILGVYGGTGISVSGAQGSPDYLTINWASAITGLSDVTAKTGTGTTVVFNNTPTLLTPVISSTGFGNANHNHSGTTSGGTLTLASSITDEGSLAYLSAVTTTQITNDTIREIDLHVTSGIESNGLILASDGAQGFKWVTDQTGGGDPDQDLYDEVLTDSGTVTADQASDQLGIYGGTGISVSGAQGSPDYLTINWASAITGLSDVTAKSGSGTTVIFQNTPTLLTPVISSTGFANANHNHSGTTSGGTLTLASSITDEGSLAYLNSATTNEITNDTIREIDLHVTSGTESNGLILASDGAQGFKWVTDQTGGGDPDQDLYDEVLTDSGTVTADQPSDQLGIYGGTGISVSGTQGSPDYLTINWASAITGLSDVTAKTGTGTTVVFNNTPTLLTPVIASNGFINAQHAHTGVSSGGTLTLASSISDEGSLAYLSEVGTTQITNDTIREIDLHVTSGTESNGLILASDGAQGFKWVSDQVGSGDPDQDLFHQVVPEFGDTVAANSATTSLLMTGNSQISVVGTNATKLIEVNYIGSQFTTIDPSSGQNVYSTSASDTVYFNGAAGLQVTGTTASKIVTFAETNNLETVTSGIVAGQIPVGDGTGTVNYAAPKWSVTVDGTDQAVKLTGDVSTPGVSKVYGTDELGDRGWQDQAIESSYTRITSTGEDLYASVSDQLILTTGSGLTISGVASSDTLTFTGDHDLLPNFVANEHIDWTQDQGTTNVHRNNLEQFTSTLQGVVPQSGGGTINYLRADGEWADPGSSGITDHGALTGLADDDHSQYFLLNGRSGGQVAYGGTGAGDDLTLRTTSNASKGSYILPDIAATSASPSSGFTVRINQSGVLSSDQYIDTFDLENDSLYGNGVRMEDVHSTAAGNGHASPDRANQIVKTDYNLGFSYGGDAVTDGNFHIAVNGSTQQAFLSLTQMATTKGMAAGTNEGWIYVYDSSGTSKMYAVAEDSNVNISPHDLNGRWVHDSSSPISKSRLHVEMQTLMRWVAEKYCEEKGIPLEEVYDLMELSDDNIYVETRVRDDPKEKRRKLRQKELADVDDMRKKIKAAEEKAERARAAEAQARAELAAVKTQLASKP